MSFNTTWARRRTGEPCALKRALFSSRLTVDSVRVFCLFVFIEKERLCVYDCCGYSSAASRRRKRQQLEKEERVNGTAPPAVRRGTGTCRYCHWARTRSSPPSSIESKFTMVGLTRTAESQSSIGLVIRFRRELTYPRYIKK